MKCKYCGSEWQSRTEVQTCPFCGISLTESPVFTDIGQTLCFILDTYSKQIDKNPNSIIAYLSDLAPNLTKERRLLKMCVDAGILGKLLSITDEAERNLASKRAVALLNNEYFIETKRAEEAVGWITAAVFRTSLVGGRVPVPRAQLEKELSEQREYIQELCGELEKQAELKKKLHLTVNKIGEQRKYIQELQEAAEMQAELSKRERIKLEEMLCASQKELDAQREENRKLREALEKRDSEEPDFGLTRTDPDLDLTAWPAPVELDDLLSPERVRKPAFYNSLGNVVNYVPAEYVELEVQEAQEVQPHTLRRIGRNEPCPCGSGLKWKRCICPQYHPDLK